MLLVGVAALWYLRGVVTSLRPLIIMLLVSLFLSFALEPAVNRLERLGLRRGLGTALVFSVGIAALGGFGVQVGSLLAEQVTEFNENVPGYLTEVDNFLDNNFGIENATEDLRARYDSGALASLLGNLADDLARFGSTVANVLFQLFTIGLFTFYLVAEGPKVRRMICSFLAPRRQRLVLDVWDVAVEKTGGYILSRSLLGIISAGVHWAAFEIIGLPSALALALWVGVMSQFVPVVGTYIAGALPVLIGLLSEPIDGLSAVIVVAVYQQVENYLLSSCLVGVLAQRLVRIVCQHCRSGYPGDLEQLKSLGIVLNGDPSITLYQGKGCEACGFTGYETRKGIFELMEIDDEIRRMVVTNQAANTIAQYARKQGMKTLREDGFDKVLTGTTTLDEVLRVTQDV